MAESWRKFWQHEIFPVGSWFSCWTWRNIWTVYLLLGEFEHVCNTQMAPCYFLLDDSVWKSNVAKWNQPQEVGSLYKYINRT